MNRLINRIISLCSYIKCSYSFSELNKWINAKVHKHFTYKNFLRLVSIISDFLLYQLDEFKLHVFDCLLAGNFNKIFDNMTVKECIGFVICVFLLALVIAIIKLIVDNRFGVNPYSCNWQKRKNFEEAGGYAAHIVVMILDYLNGSSYNIFNDKWMIIRVIKLILSRYLWLVGWFDINCIPIYFKNL